MITTYGKENFVRFLAGNSSSIGQFLAFGVGTTAATLNDNGLEYEVARYPVTSISPDVNGLKLVIKTVIPRGVAFEIREVGLLNAVGNDASRTLLSVDSALASWSTGTLVAGSRTGGNSLRLSPAASATVTSSLPGFEGSLEGFSIDDNIQIAANASNANGSIVVRLGRDSSNYYQFSTSLASGYNIKTVSKSQMTTVGTPTSAITYVAVQGVANSSGSVNIDFQGVRINFIGQRPTENILISRSVLASPVVKDTAKETEVEYTIGVDFA